MAAAGAHPGRDGGADLGLDDFAVEKRDMLRPGQPDQHPHPGLGRQIEQPDRRYGEDAHRVRAGAAHQREVALDRGTLGKLRAMRPRGERTVCHPLTKCFLSPAKKNLPWTRTG